MHASSSTMPLVNDSSSATALIVANVDGSSNGRDGASSVHGDDDVAAGETSSAFPAAEGVTRGRAMSKSKRKRAAQTAFTVPRLICINAVVCGLELCANAGFAYIPPLLLKAGFSETVMSYIMGIGKLR